MSYVFLNADCFAWMKQQSPNTITAIVTDPPYGVKEYSESELEKQRLGKGGVWRLPPSFYGHKRMAVPRFSVINEDPEARKNVFDFFSRWAQLSIQILVPGGHVIIASTPLLSDILAYAMRTAGFERRGEIIRTVATLRGGDRPKGAEKEFSMTSVLPRGLWEPWGIYRKPISEKTVAENLRKWKSGALRRDSENVPFADLIESCKTPRVERNIAPHPNVKPQAFMRKIVHASLPLGEGIVLDPFAGSGTTIAAAEFCGYESIGLEKDLTFYEIGKKAIPLLSSLYITTPDLL